MKILVFGNPLVKEDSLALKLLPKLKETLPQHEFIEADSTESLEQYGPNLNIIDVVHDIKEPVIITDINKLSKSKVYSMHDFDLAHNLKLLMQAGKIKGVKILGLPWDMNEEKALDYCQSILRK
jgi:Ni,Fe-hydrogenase maturation factor